MNNKKIKKLTADELIELIKSLDISVYSFAFGCFTYSLDFPLPEPFNSQRKAFIDYFNLPYKKRKTAKKPEYNMVAAMDYWLETTGIGKWEEVEQYGGADQGSTWYSIKYFEDHDVYIKTDGHHQSYSGTEFPYGYGKEVFPKEKTITVYE